MVFKKKEGFPGGSNDKESSCNAGDLGSIPGLGRSPGEENGYPLQYSGLENSKDYIVHGGEGNGTPTPVLLPGESHGQRSLVLQSLESLQVGHD